MKQSTFTAAFTAMAIAVIVPFALAQTTSNSDTAPPAASSRSYQSGPNTAGGQAPVQGVYAPGMMGGQVQGQGAYAPGAMRADAQAQGGYWSGMMGGYGAGWMGGYGGIWVLVLLAAGVVGVLAWAGKQKGKWP